MKIWTMGGGFDGWTIKPFKSFPSRESLLKILIDHQNEDSETEHCVVFSEEEEAVLRAMAVPLFPPNMGPYHFLDAICGQLRSMFRNPPYVTYVHADPPESLLSKNKLRLAIRFNQKF